MIDLVIERGALVDDVVAAVVTNVLAVVEKEAVVGCGWCIRRTIRGDD